MDVECGGRCAKAEKLAAKAIALDETNSGAHEIMGRVLTKLENYDRALEELKRAIALNPSDADGYEGLSNLLVLMGDFDGAIRAIDVFSEFQPSLSAGTFFNLGTAQLLSGRSENSVRTLERSVERYPSISFNNAVLAAAYAAAGRKADAERRAAIVRRQFPFFSSDNFGSQFRKPQDRGARGELERGWFVRNESTYFGPCNFRQLASAKAATSAGFPLNLSTPIFPLKT